MQFYNSKAYVQLNNQAPKFYLVLILARERVALVSWFFGVTYLFYLQYIYSGSKIVTHNETSHIEPTLEGPQIYSYGI